MIESSRITTSLPPSTSRFERSSAISATWMCSSVGRSLDDPITSPLMFRFMSVTSSGRSSTRSTVRCTSGRFEVIACAIRCSMMVLPALGGEVMSPRAPSPMGEIRSSTRPISSSGRVSITSFSVGSVAVRLWKCVRRATARGSAPSSVSSRVRIRFMLRTAAAPFTSMPACMWLRSIRCRGTSTSNGWGR